jgi:hypothetical protein
MDKATYVYRFMYYLHHLLIYQLFFRHYDFILKFEPKINDFNYHINIFKF